MIAEFTQRWSSPGAKALYECLQAEIAKACVPSFPIRGPEEARRFLNNALESTAQLRAECARIYSQCTTPVVLIKWGEYD